MTSENQPKKDWVKPLPGQAKNLTQVQSQFKDDADINKMVERAKKGVPIGTGFGNGLPGPGRQPVFGHYPSEQYIEMVNHVHSVTEAFRRLPARVRDRFQNSPHLAIKFLENPDNAAECVKLGLLAVPEGYKLKGNKLVEVPDPNQLDLVQEAAKGSQSAPKADPEAQPGYQNKPDK